MLTIRAMLPMAIAAMASTVVILSPSVKSAQISDAEKNTSGDRGDLAVKACAIGLAQRVGGEGVLSAAARIARCEEIVGDTAQVVR